MEWSSRLRTLPLAPVVITGAVLAVCSPAAQSSEDATGHRGRATAASRSEEGRATEGSEYRSNDPRAIEAFFASESYLPGTDSVLRFETSLHAVRLEIFHAGPEWGKTGGNMAMRGIRVARPVPLRRIRVGGTLHVRIGDWPSGLYFARVTAPHGRVGYAPFVVLPRRLGQHRVAVVLPTRTWQAYNFRDDDRDGRGDSWYATRGVSTARLHRPFLNRGVPPHFRTYDLPFLHWLSRTGKNVDFLSQAELDEMQSGGALRRNYDLLVFPGHHEYVTAAEYDVVEGFRDLGGSLVFLSANNFYWRIDLDHGLMTRVARWRDLGRPEAALLGVQFIANDMGEHRGRWILRAAPATRSLFAGTGSHVGEEFSFGGIEVDHTAPSSPPGTQVVAEIPDVLGPGLTAQMTYYTTPRGAKVFSAGAFTLAGSMRQQAVRRLVENIWSMTACPSPGQCQHSRR